VAKPLALSIINKDTIDYDINKSWLLHIKIHYNSMDKRQIYSIKMLSMVPLNVADASAEDQSSPSSNSGGTAARPQRAPPCGDIRRLSDEWMSMGNHLEAPRRLYLVLGVPWGMLYLALHEILFGREANLVSIKSASSRFSRFAALPCRHHISHVRTPNYPNSVSRLCATKLSSTFIFISFLGNEDKISKSALEDNLFRFRTDCAAGISGPYLLAPLFELGLPHVQIEGIFKAHYFGSQSFAIKVRLSL
jgi:hypothetical protein